MLRRPTLRRMVAWLVVVLLAGCGTPSTPSGRSALVLPTPGTVILPTVTWQPPTPTPTFTPTPTPSPVRPTPTPTRVAHVYGWVATQAANLREAPSVQARVVARLPGGTTLVLLGRTPEGAWLYVEAQPTNGSPTRGWIAASIVVTFADIGQLPTVKPALKP